MGVIEKATSWAESIAKDDTHGYDQIHRWSPDYDCSSLVISAFNYAGVKTGATYTGNMYNLFLKHGFKDVTKTVNLATGSGLQRGDVLFVHNSNHQHTAIYTGNGYEVEASINEKGTATGGKTGDQTGREILIRTYRPSFFTTVLRYNDNTNTASVDDIAMDVIRGKYGNGNQRKQLLEEMGVSYEAVQARVNQILRGK